VALRLTVALLMLVVTAAIAGRRVAWLAKLIRSGQPAPGRWDGIEKRLRAQLVEVFGQRRLLRWSVPGVAHFLTFWGFIVLGLTIIEAYGALVIDKDFAFPFFGHARWLGFLEDFFAVAVLLGLITFAILRLRQAPAREHRASRFYGSHTRAAWVILGMITLVVVTLLLYRGAQYNTGHFPWGRSKAPFASYVVSRILGDGAYNQGVETFFLLAQMAVIFGFMIIVVYSKHLHIALAPLNVTTKRLPDALGPLLPVADAEGKPIDFSDVENLSEDTQFGKGKIEDFTWKGYLDFSTCTECGRCQSQCPAWNTGKPLSPKLLIMDLRDHLFAKAPYLIGGKSVPDGATATGHEPHGAHVPESGFARIEGSGPDQAVRPLVGDLASGGVIDPDVLWSCTTCGACVEQCPVDIEHIDHIVDMRRYQVLIESSFPSELNGLFKGLENKGNPWNMNPSGRMDWAKDLPFEVKQVGTDVETLAEVEYLFWVGCAGALEDRSKKVTRAFAELLHTAGVEFAILGAGETCTGDPARRLGNEFLFQMLAQQTAEMINSVFEGREPIHRKIVTTCPHCMNTLGREYPQLDGHYEVVHHTQLLNKLVREGKLVPVAAPAGSDAQDVTFHDPCYLGRHNGVYSPPRELVGAAGAQLTEMPRHADRSMCCGAGGARMWMEERTGKRINTERIDEALGTDPDTISTGCPYCLVMLGDAVAAKKASGEAKESLEVVDVAQVLVRSIQPPTPPADAAPPAAPAAPAPADQPTG